MFLAARSRSVHPSCSSSWRTLPPTRKVVSSTMIPPPPTLVSYAKTPLRQENLNIIPAQPSIQSCTPGHKQTTHAANEFDAHHKHKLFFFSGVVKPKRPSFCNTRPDLSCTLQSALCTLHSACCNSHATFSLRRAPTLTLFRPRASFPTQLTSLTATPRLPFLALHFPHISPSYLYYS
jgi:hypothetical protein